MGLDAVELVMAFEDEFCLYISDVEAEKMVTPGDTVRFLVEQLGFRMASKGCPTAHFFHQLRRELVEQCDVRKASVRPSSRIGDVVSQPRQRKGWPKIARKLGLHEPPRKWSAPFAARFPEPSLTLRHLVESSCATEFINSAGEVDEERVWQRVRRLTAELAGIKESEVHRHSRYLYDLF